MLAKAPRAADAVDVGLAVGLAVHVHGEVVVHDDCHLERPRP